MAEQVTRGSKQFDQVFYVSGNACMHRFADKSLVFFNRSSGVQQAAGCFKASDGTGYLNFESPEGRPMLIITKTEARVYSPEGHLRVSQPFEAHGKPVAFPAIQLKGPCGLRLSVRGKRRITIEVPGIRKAIEIATPQVENSRAKERLAERARLAKAMERAATGGDEPGSMAPYVVVDRSPDDPGFRPMFAAPLPKFTMEERRRASQLRRERRAALTSSGALDTTAKRLAHIHQHGLALARPSGSGRELRDIAAGLLPLATAKRKGVGARVTPAAPVHDAGRLLAAATSQMGQSLHPRGSRATATRRRLAPGNREASIAEVVADLDGVTRRLRSGALVSGVTAAKRAVSSSVGAASLADARGMRRRAASDAIRRRGVKHHLSCGSKIVVPRPPRELPRVSPDRLLSASEGLRPGRLLVAVLVAVGPGCPQAVKAAGTAALAMELAAVRLSKRSRAKAHPRSSGTATATSRPPLRGPSAATSSIGTRTSSSLQLAGRTRGSSSSIGMSSTTAGALGSSRILGVLTKLAPRAEEAAERERERQESKSQSYSGNWQAAAKTRRVDTVSSHLAATQDLRPSELEAVCEQGLQTWLRRVPNAAHQLAAAREAGTLADVLPFDFARCNVGGPAGKELLARLGFRAAPVLAILRRGDIVFAGVASSKQRSIVDPVAVAAQCFECLQ